MDCITELINQLICLIHPHLRLTQYSPPKQTLSCSLVFNPLFTQIAIISWYSLSLIFPFILFHYMKEQDLIRTAIDLLDWDKALRFNDVDKQVAIFSDILMNIMQNFVSNETIICDDRDPRG